MQGGKRRTLLLALEFLPPLADTLELLLCGTQHPKAQVAILWLCAWCSLSEIQALEFLSTLVEILHVEGCILTDVEANLLVPSLVEKVSLTACRCVIDLPSPSDNPCQ